MEENDQKVFFSGFVSAKRISPEDWTVPKAHALAEPCCHCSVSFA